MNFIVLSIFFTLTISKIISNWRKRDLNFRKNYIYNCRFSLSLFFSLWLLRFSKSRKFLFQIQKSSFHGQEHEKFQNFLLATGCSSVKILSQDCTERIHSRGSSMVRKASLRESEGTESPFLAVLTRMDRHNFSADRNVPAQANEPDKIRKVGIHYPESFVPVSMFPCSVLQRLHDRPSMICDCRSADGPAELLPPLDNPRTICPEIVEILRASFSMKHVRGFWTLTGFLQGRDKIFCSLPDFPLARRFEVPSDF